MSQIPGLNGPLPGLPHLKARVLRSERCEKCKWRGDEVQKGQFECRESPPTATTIMVPQPGVRGHGFMTHTTFPIIQADSWCGKWAPRIEGAN